MTKHKDGDIRRTEGEDVKVGEEAYLCCGVCGGTAMSWRYQNPALQACSSKTERAGATIETYFTCHPDAKAKTAIRPVVVWQRGTTEIMCCGEWLLCDRFTNTCDKCGTDYNGSAQQLAPREQWGEETGEHWTECY